MSWNLRTFGSQEIRADDYRRIVDIILNSNADVVCIQEVQCGPYCPRELGANIDFSISWLLIMIRMKLAAGDPGAGWDSDVSGVNLAMTGSMRDAYAFFWKKTPKSSKYAHSDPVNQIEKISSPVILRTPKSRSFPGRRPGMFSINVITAKSVTPVNIVSYHALTPCNKFKASKGAGLGINKLAEFLEIGGEIVLRQAGYPLKPLNPLPQMDTIVLGDFNYCMTKSLATEVYKNLLTNYQPCINDPSEEEQRKTTYSADPSEPFKESSAYDNIFVLKKHDKFTPSLVFNDSTGVIDFIRDEAEKLGQAAGIQYWPTETAWYVIYKDTYKDQHAKYGLSDHLPVWSDFTVNDGSSSTTSSNILPTSGDNNNCLFHAVFGVLNPFTGMYVDGNARQNRTNLADALATYNAGNPFPNLNVQQAVLRAMYVSYEGYTEVTDKLAELIASDGGINPFAQDWFANYYIGYLFGMRIGRMMYVEEVELVAMHWNITINLYGINQGSYDYIQVNPGQGQTVSIFHHGLHFNRYNAG